MNMIFLSTIATSLCAIAATVAIFSASGMDERSIGFFSWWTSMPYLGYCVLSLAVRRNRRTSEFILVSTLFAGGLAVLLYEGNLRPFIEARKMGVEPPMNCGGPLVELAFPVLQWLAVAVLAAVAMAMRPHRDVENLVVDKL